MTKNPTELSIIIQNLKDGNLDDSLKQLKGIIINNSNKNLVYKIFASIYFQKKKLGKCNRILSKNVIF